MKQLLTFILLAPALAFGQVAQVVQTNEVLAAPQAGVVSIAEGYEFRLTVLVVESDLSPKNLSGARPFWSIEGAVDGVTNSAGAATGTLVNASAGRLLYARSSLAAGDYLVRAWYASADTNVEDTVVAWFPLEVTAASAGLFSYSLSLNPLIPSNGTVGTMLQPWSAIWANEGRFKTLYADSLDVISGVSAADTGAWKLVGSTGQGSMSNAYPNYFNLIGSSNYPAENLSGSELPALSGRLLTGLDYGSISNPPNISSGGGITIYTNAYGQMFVTNAAGYAVTIDGAELPSGPFAWFRDYSLPDSTTSTHIGGWAFSTTNNMAILTSPNPESVNVPRMVEKQRIPDNATSSWWRTGFRVVSLPSVAADASPILRLALGAGVSETQTWNLISLWQNNGDWSLQGYSPAQIGGGGSWSGATGSQTNPTAIAANPNGVALTARGIGRGDSFWILHDYNGTNLLRGGIALDAAGIPFMPYQQTGKTNAAPASWVGIAFCAASLRHQPVTFAFDSFFLQTNQLWWPAP